MILISLKTVYRTQREYLVTQLTPLHPSNSSDGKTFEYIDEHHFQRRVTQYDTLGVRLG